MKTSAGVDPQRNLGDDHELGGTRTRQHGDGVTALGQTRFDLTSIALSGPLEAPNPSEARGWRLDQLLLVGTVAPMMVLLAVLGVLSALTVKTQFETTGQLYTERFQQQARELGGTVAHTLSLTSASSFRDNNFAFLSEIAKAIVKDNPNVLRVQMFDGAGLSVADSDAKGAQETLRPNHPRTRSWMTSSYAGQPVFEYQEPIDYGSRSEQGLVSVTYSLEELQGQLRELETNKQAAVRAITLRTIGFGVVLVVLAIGIGVLQGRNITRPLKSLTERALQLAQGDLDSRVDTQGRSSREVHTLGRVFNFMADRLKTLLGNARAQAVLEREVQLARQVQETFLPGREPFALGPVRVAGACVTADACGGDWWLRAAIDDVRVVVGIGDVTGHGLSTALVATSATSGFAAAMRLIEPGQITAPLLIQSLNQTLFHVGRGAYQMSGALAVIHAGTGDIEFASGGHPSACLYNRHDKQVTTLRARGALLGSSADSQYSSQRAQLRHGDVLVWYTDGLTESRDPAGKVYGFQRLADKLRECGHLPAEQIRDEIFADVRAYTHEQPQQDDITSFVVEYGPPPRRATSP